MLISILIPRTEPPSLFRGRGEHPKQGMIKRRIHPEVSRRIALELSRSRSRRIALELSRSRRIVLELSPRLSSLSVVLDFRDATLSSGRHHQL